MSSQFKLPPWITIKLDSKTTKIYFRFSQELWAKVMWGYIKTYSNENQRESKIKDSWSGLCTKSHWGEKNRSVSGGCVRLCLGHFRSEIPATPGQKEEWAQWETNTHTHKGQAHWHKWDWHARKMATTLPPPPSWSRRVTMDTVPTIWGMAGTQVIVV